MVHEARGFAPGDHVCWVYETPADFAVAAAQFLVEGLEQGQRISYVGTDVGGLTAQFAEVGGGWDELIRQGAVQVASPQASYGDGDAFDVDGQVRFWGRAAGAAVGAGFTGLRVAAGITPLIPTPRAVDLFARYEHLVDQYFATGPPLSGMCGYHGDELTGETVAKIACLHPTVNLDVARFRLCGSTRAAAALSGEIDVASAQLFPAVVELALEPSGGEIVLDVRDLEFIDSIGLLYLADFARRRNATAVLIDPPGIVRRLIDALGVDGVRVERT
jgi:anti-anti-sigma factor